MCKLGGAFFESPFKKFSCKHPLWHGKARQSKARQGKCLQSPSVPPSPSPLPSPFSMNIEMMITDTNE